jgi:hypothetical protein
MFSAIIFGLTQAAATAVPTVLPPRPPVQATTTASATIVEAVRIDFSRIPVPRRPRTDGLRVAEFE